METVHITKCEVGDIIRYKSSKKPYLVAAKTPGGYFLFSKTQQYDSTINNFEVVRIIKGNGILPEKFEDKELNLLLIEAKEVLKKGLKSSTKITGVRITNDSRILLQIPKRTMYFNKWIGPPLLDMFGKVTVSYDGNQMFAELAIMKQFIKEGWESRWMEVYGKPNLNPIFLSDWKNDRYKNQVHHPIENNAMNKILSAIAKNNNNSFAGCWDVLCWKNNDILFVESKLSKKDKIRNTQIGWLNASLKYGLKPENFLVLEWDFKDF